MAQVLEVGSQICLNNITGNAIPVVQSSPPSWIPGRYWIDSANSYVPKEYNGSAWVVAPMQRYLCLAIADPTDAVDQPGVVEVQTAGYARQPVTFSPATATYPAVGGNTNTITWGPFTTDMLLPALYIVLCTTATGEDGWPLYAWDIPDEKVATSQTIQVAPNKLKLSES